MQTVCSHCKAAMSCGAQEKSCWCLALPTLPSNQYQADLGCLCATCLAAQLDSGVVLYGIASCDTVKKARAWLAANSVAYAFWDYKKQGAPLAKLPHWLSALGWQRVVNTRGTTWRTLASEAQAAVVDEDSAYAVLSAHTSTIKRPIVAWGNTYGGHLTVGFDEAQWQSIIKI